MVNSQGKPLKIGMSGLNGTTPKGLKIAYRTLMFLSLMWGTVIQPNLNIPEHVQAEINRWLLVANTGFYQICQFFGWSQPEKDEDKEAQEN